MKMGKDVKQQHVDADDDGGGGGVGGEDDGNNRMWDQHEGHLPWEALRWMVYQMNGSDGTCWAEEYGGDDGAVVAVDCNH